VPEHSDSEFIIGNFSTRPARCPSVNLLSPLAIGEKEEQKYFSSFGVPGTLLVIRLVMAIPSCVRVLKRCDSSIEFLLQSRYQVVPYW